MADDEAVTESAADPVPTGGRSPDQYRDQVDALRGRVDLFGKSLAGLATVGTGAVGLAKVGDLFPYGNEIAWLVAAVLGLLAAAAGALTVAVRLMNVGQPLVIDPDLNATNWRWHERGYAEDIFRAAARRFGYASLAGLQQRERVLRSTAARASTDKEATRRTASADAVKAEIEGALARTQLAIVRRRATRAVCGVMSILCYALVATGLVVFALGADAVASSRTDPIAIAKSCGEARKAGATNEELKGTECSSRNDEEAPATPSTPTAEEARADLAQRLTEAWVKCASFSTDGAATKGRPLDGRDCEAIRGALTVLTGQ